MSTTILRTDGQEVRLENILVRRKNPSRSVMYPMIPHKLVTVIDAMTVAPTGHLSGGGVLLLFITATTSVAPHKVEHEKVLKMSLK